ncbi:MAG: DUF3488 and DUF4129 domain-containing transglutaminase family protein [Bradymonadia bacterium]
MRFRHIHQTVSYLLVLTSTLVLVTSGGLNPIVSGAALLAFPLSWRWGRADGEPGSPIVWNLLTLGALAWAILEGLSGAPLLPVGANFLTCLVINKLFNRSALRDLQQLYLLSFLQMVAGTAMNTGLLFAVAFVGYIIFATWTLMLFHLRREVEENFLLKYEQGPQKGRPVQVERVLNSRRLVTRRFLAMTSLIAIVIFTGSTVVFFLFPRVGFGWLSQGARDGVQMTGFSDQIELGGHGRIKQDKTVVMRVHLDPPEARQTMPLYWRGISFDHYDGERWKKTQRRRRGLPVAFDGSVSMPWAPRDATEGLVRQEIYLEPMEQQVIFGLSPLLSITLTDERQPFKQSGLDLDENGDVFYSQTGALAFRYDAFSAPPRAPDTASMSLEDYRRALSRPKMEDFARRFTQLPDDLSPEIEALADEVVGDANTVAEVVHRLRRHLKSDYSYTLDLERDPSRPPLEDFLFARRKGHCEYFATAMVVLLRTQGVAARTVNGFHGGTWNGVGEYIAVRQGEAHAWVEIWLPGAGQSPRAWWLQDPTPAADQSAVAMETPSWFAQSIDALKLRWYKWVIEYDLGAQIEALRSFAQGLRSAFRGAKDFMQWRPGDTTLWISGALALVFFGGWAWRRWPGLSSPRGGDADPRARATIGVISNLESLYARHGITRPAHLTVREYLDLLESRGAPGLPLAREIISMYEEARFGGAAMSPEQRRSASATLKALKAALDAA